MGVYLLVNFPSNYIIDKYGCRVGVTLGTVLTFTSFYNEEHNQQKANKNAHTTHTRHRHTRRRRRRDAARENKSATRSAAACVRVRAAMCDVRA